MLKITVLISGRGIIWVLTLKWDKMCKAFIRKNVLRENWEGAGKGLESLQTKMLV